MPLAKAERSADFTEWLRANGYDGAIAWSQIMILDSEQAKRSDLVVRDDNGNIIPLSERFDSSKTDIRWRKTGKKNNPDDQRTSASGSANQQRSIQENTSSGELLAAAESMGVKGNITQAREKVKGAIIELGKIYKAVGAYKQSVSPIFNLNALYGALMAAP